MFQRLSQSLLNLHRGGPLDDLFVPTEGPSVGPALLSSEAGTVEAVRVQELQQRLSQVSGPGRVSRRINFVEPEIRAVEAGQNGLELPGFLHKPCRYQAFDAKTAVAAMRRHTVPLAVLLPAQDQSHAREEPQVTLSLAQVGLADESGRLQRNGLEDRPSVAVGRGDLQRAGDARDAHAHRTT